jgi:hypothetical protein
MAKVRYMAGDGHVWRSQKGNTYHFPSSGYLEVSDADDLKQLSKLGGFLIQDSGGKPAASGPSIPAATNPPESRKKKEGK